MARIDFLNGHNCHQYEALTINGDLKVEFMQISGLVSHPTDEIYEIEYEGGGKIRTTGSHSVFVFDANGVRAKYVSELREGEYLVTLLASSENGFESNHVLRIKDYINPDELERNLRVKKSVEARRRVLRCLEGGLKGLKELTRASGIGYKTLMDMVEHGVILRKDKKYGITEKGLRELKNNMEESKYRIYRRILNLPGDLEERSYLRRLLVIFISIRYSSLWPRLGF